MAGFVVSKGPQEYEECGVKRNARQRSDGFKVCCKVGCQVAEQKYVMPDGLGQMEQSLLNGGRRCFQAAQDIQRMWNQKRCALPG